MKIISYLFLVIAVVSAMFATMTAYAIVGQSISSIFKLSSQTNYQYYFDNTWYFLLVSIFVTFLSVMLCLKFAPLKKAQ